MRAQLDWKFFLKAWIWYGLLLVRLCACLPYLAACGSVELDPALYGFTEADLDREFFLGVWRMSGFLHENRPVQTLRSILTRLQQVSTASHSPFIHCVGNEKHICTLTRLQQASTA